MIVVDLAAVRRASSTHANLLAIGEKLTYVARVVIVAAFGAYGLAEAYRRGRRDGHAEYLFVEPQAKES